MFGNTQLESCHTVSAIFFLTGEMPEWSNGPVSKAGVGFTLPRVRIPISPPFHFYLPETAKFTS